ncbi:MAG: retron St85 family RNA-directed DNA polymerase, partial [Ruminococcus sp.]|nr:retron St85 family RNA-directed DNA polymerase [Ruminococcus sp.]
FSMLVGLEHNYICSMAYSPKHFYRVFYIKKSNGKNREISEPLPDLKYVQKWILNNILVKNKVSPYAKAYVPKSSVKHNARFHKKQKVVLSMDIKNFFPSINIKSIVGIFKTMGYFEDVACFLAYLCCYNNCLPQGAPTSPYLSNLRLLEFDSMIAEYTTSRKIRYTRYADDITFSGDFNPHEVIKYVRNCVWNAGFVINSEKTRVAYGNSRQEVTGVVVNSVMQISKVERKKIRQEVYYIKKYGLESHLSHIKEKRAHYLQHLLGKINFALYINSKDKELKNYYDFILSLLKDDISDS